MKGNALKKLFLPLLFCGLSSVWAGNCSPFDQKCIAAQKAKKAASVTTPKSAPAAAPKSVVKAKPKVAKNLKPIASKKRKQSIDDDYAEELRQSILRGQRDASESDQEDQDLRAQILQRQIDSLRAVQSQQQEAELARELENRKAERERKKLEEALIQQQKEAEEAQKEAQLRQEMAERALAARQEAEAALLKRQIDSLQSKQLSQSQELNLFKWRSDSLNRSIKKVFSVQALGLASLDGLFYDIASVDTNVFSSAWDWNTDFELSTALVLGANRYRLSYGFSNENHQGKYVDSSAFNYYDQWKSSWQTYGFWIGFSDNFITKSSVEWGLRYGIGSVANYKTNKNDKYANLIKVADQGNSNSYEITLRQTSSWAIPITWGMSVGTENQRFWDESSRWGFLMKFQVGLGLNLNIY